MSDRPAIPHEPPPEFAGVRAAVEQTREAKRWTRKLAEAGKLSGRPVKQIPIYRMKKEPQDIIA